MKTTGRISIIAIVLYAFLALVQLWFEVFSGETFGKITITFGVFVGALVLSAIIRREYVQEESLKKEGYID